MRRRHFLYASAAATAAILANAAPAAGVPGVLRRSRAGTLTTLDPQRLGSSLDAEIAAELFVGLTTTDARGRLVGGCAANWQRSSDGLSWTFKLRDDAAWSDGQPLGAEDFVFSVRRFMSPEAAATLAFRFDAIKNGSAVRAGRLPLASLGISAPDAQTVRFELAQPETDLPALLAALYPVPSHAIAKYGRDWAKPAVVVTNGAYRVRSWAQSGTVDLVANPRFWSASDVAAPRVQWISGIDDATRLRLYLSDQLDLVQISDGTALALAKQQRAKELRTTPAWGAGWLGVNCRRGKLVEPDVRRALSLGVDRAVLASKVRQLDERPWESIVPAAVTDYGAPVLPEHSLWPRSQRLAVARELLGKHGIGPRRRVTLQSLYAANPVTQRMFLAIGAMWRPLGVDLELVGLETRAYSIRLRAGEYDLQDYVPFATIQTIGTFIGRFASDSFLNFMFYNNVEVDRLSALAERQLEPAMRIARYREVERILLRDYPVIPLYSATAHRLVAPRVAGWRDHEALTTPSRFLGLTD
ncbi:MAG: peptide ABC transporter substrate-binding protein [Pseudomonadales bacterium]|nr:peptide ABC transporter substrate-binding protein [Pseudomonadales bacterium]